MNKSLVVLGVVGALLLTFFVGFIGWRNEAVGFENQIKAKYADNKNVYDNGWKEVVEKMQVPEAALGQLRELYDGVMQGRYGTDGSKAMFQFIKEQNPQIDFRIYEQVQQSVEAFRRGFTQGQRELVDIKRGYGNHLEKFPGALYNAFSGFPRIDLSKYDIVTSTRTEKAFEEKKDEPLELLRRKQNIGSEKAGPR